MQVSQWAAHHSEENFADPEEFVPERWLDGEDGVGDDGKGTKWKREEKYEGDRRGAMQPFSFGPRNCLGKVSFFSPFFSDLILPLTSFQNRISPSQKCASSWPNYYGPLI